MSDTYKIAAEVVPSKRQLEWQKLEFYAFCHFGMNTFTNKEWGDGTDQPEKFNPKNFDAEQWARVIKSGGMRGIILTCKHHDGFCLWPSKYTDYTVAASPFKDGKGDIVKEVSDACRKYGLKFGVYLSPWDRHESTYGQGEAYNEYYKNQLRELLTNYGELFCVWLDGACGEGKNGKVQQYDWQGYYKVVRELQPDAVISISGPDVRWVGNEAGVCRESEWSVVPSYLAISEYTAEHSQKEDSKKFRKQKKEMVLDLGSQKAIKNESDLIWFPAEVDTSLRPGWFYHKDEDTRQKDLFKLMQIYLSSVGGNSNLLLNIPPDTNGQICKNDELVLDSFGRALKRKFYDRVSENAVITASSQSDDLHTAKNINGNEDCFWQASENDEKPELIIDFGEEKEFDSVILQENIATGQQIEEFTVYYEAGGKFKKLYKGTVIGYKKIIALKDSMISRKIKIVIEKYRVKSTIFNIEVYNSKQ